MKVTIKAIAAAIIPLLFAFTHAHGLSIMSINDAPPPVMVQPVNITIAGFSPGTYQMTVSGDYGYERYRIRPLSPLHVHAGGIKLSASGAFTDAIGWNIALGLDWPGLVSRHMSMRTGSSFIHCSASLVWRFIGKPDSSSCSLFTGAAFSYSAMRGYYKRYLPGPPDLFYLAKTTVRVDALGPACGLFAGLQPSLQLGNTVSVRPFAAYHVIFDASVFDYRVNIKLLNEPGDYSGPAYFKYRQSRDPRKPLHGILLGLELNVRGIGAHAMAQIFPASSRTIYGFGLSYTHSFNAKNTGGKGA